MYSCEHRGKNVPGYQEVIMESLSRDMKIKEALEGISVNTPKCRTYTFLKYLN